jgi:hypothetical protein
MTERALVSRHTMELATALTTAAVGAAVMWGSIEHDIGWSDSGPGAGYFPFRVGALIVLASLVNVVSAFRLRPAEVSVFLTRLQAGRVLSFTVPVFGFVLLSVFLGLYVATVLYLVFTMVFQGGYRLPFAIAVALGVAVAMRVIFPIWFQVPLLTGPLEAWLGFY